MPLLSAGICDIGRKRKTNQDSIHLDPKRKLFVVADGMGGHSGGDIASALAVEHIPKSISTKAKNDDPIEFIQESITCANTKILARAKEEPHLMGMGTTVVTFVFQGQNLYIGNVGDSRAYLINQNKLYQMTKDHSLVQEKMNMGIYGREEAASDPQKNVLVRTVGFEEDVEADIYTYRVSRNDLFLACSDGLHGVVSDQDIIYLINQHLPDPANATQEDLQNCAQYLVDQANSNGGIDNISVVLVLAQ